MGLVIGGEQGVRGGFGYHGLIVLETALGITLATPRRWFTKNHHLSVFSGVFQLLQFVI